MIHAVPSILFYALFIIYLFMGLYGFAINPGGRQNRIFFLLCISFSIWTFSFAVLNSTDTLAEALFWRRMASLGWGVTFSIILHFILIWTDHVRFTDKKKKLFVIYIPAIISVFVFGFYTPIAGRQYRLILTEVGWGNVPLNNFWDIFYYSYYIGFSLLTLILLILRYRKADNRYTKRQAMLLLSTFVISIIAGSITEMLANSLLPHKIPSMAPVFILLPIISIFYIIKKYHFLMAEKKDSLSLVMILNGQRHSTYIQYIALVYLLGVILNFLQYFFYPTSLYSLILYSTLILFLGMFIFFIPFFRITIKVQDIILTLVIAITIPIIMFRFLYTYNNNIVWPIPLIFMMLTIIFNNKRMLYVISLSTITTALIAWVIVPETIVTVNSLDYIARLGLYAMGVILAVYINRTYIKKLKENEKQVEFQKMISEISTNFVTVNSGNFDNKMLDMLKKSGEHTLSHRSYMALFSEDRKRAHFTYEWINSEIPVARKISYAVNIEPLDWYNNLIQNGEIIFISSLESLPPEAEIEKRIMLDHKIKSMLLVPIIKKGKVIGIIGFEHINEQNSWKLEDNELLKILANIVGEAITKIDVEREINYLAYYDVLTGLPNRTLFNNRMEQAIYMARRSEKAFGLIFIDLDGFKAVNDTLGHDWGDDLLRQIGERLLNCMRKNDTVARFGGDEFLVMVMQITDKRMVEKIVKKIMGSFEKPVIVNRQEFFITASAGIAIFPEDGEDASILVKNADLAMYHAKNGGKNRYVFCSENMKEDVIRKMKITNSLYRVLERNELYLQYQPQLDIESREIIGVEALVRWNNPELGLIPPGIFIPIAEQTGLINPIGEWILETACRQCKAWQEMGIKPLKMAVNISVEQFRNGNLLNVVMKSLKNADLEAKYLELEITEGVAMRETDIIEKTFEELKEKGVTLLIDDFGVEYSSLSRLKDLPVDKLKIDMQFVRGISVNEKDESIIKVIIHLARSLGIKVLAEGVETIEQLDFLTREKCDEVQGYYFFRPMLNSDFEKIMINK